MGVHGDVQLYFLACDAQTAVLLEGVGDRGVDEPILPRAL